MGTHDSNQPPGAERPRRRMVLRKIADAAPLLPSAPAAAAPAKEPSVAALPPTATARYRTPVAHVASKAPVDRTALRARSSAPAASTTIRPPVDPRSEAAVPIPLTRLHTPRAAFRSAIDFPTPGTADEASVRETSSASLPPLVASLPPGAPPIFVPAPASGRARASRAGRNIMVGSLAGLALLATIGGIAMGRHLAMPAAASESQPPPIVVVPSPAAAPPPSPVAAPEAPAAVPTPDPIIATSGVEDLPKAAAQPLLVAPPVARPAARPVAMPPPAAVAPPAAAPAAHANIGGPRSQTPPEAPVQGSAKDPAEAEESVAAPAIPPSPPPEVDPLVKAVKDDIKEEESHRR